MGNPQKSKGQNGTSISDIARANNGNNRKFEGQNVLIKDFGDFIATAVFEGVLGR